MSEWSSPKAKDYDCFKFSATDRRKMQYLPIYF